MEENRDYSKECGIRCRQIRMSKGMSQQALAEKVNVTPAAISKWEKEGISNIDHIMKLSNALGQDITSDQFDQEGAIGEVGKEILRILIEKGGYADLSTVERGLFGMKVDRISNELFKLERIGAAIREQYKDFSDNERDGVFVTAKGVIAYKNTVMFPNAELLNNVITMDERLADGYSSFQEIIDSDRVTKFLMKNGMRMTGFRCDYMKYLYRHFFNPIVSHNAEEAIIYNVPEVDAILGGESCYIDILRRMAQQASVEDVSNIMEDVCLDWYGMEDCDEDDYYGYQAAGMDIENMRAVKFFCDVIESMPDYKSVQYTEEDWLKESDNPDVQAAIRANRAAEHYTQMYEESIANGYTPTIQRLSDNEEAFFAGLDEASKKNSNLWFSEDKIRKFVEDNVLAPESDIEKEIDEGLRELWRTDSYVSSYYYSFPKTWEENGIAQMIRDKVGIPASE
jgi:transcriptional regulator with XRE-family HTH domain